MLTALSKVANANRVTVTVRPFSKRKLRSPNRKDTVHNFLYSWIGLSLNPQVLTHIDVDAAVGQLFALNIQTAPGQTKILEPERIFCVSTAISFVTDHEHDYFVRQLSHRHGIIFGSGCSATQCEILHYHMGDGNQSTTRQGQHALQLQLFWRCQFNHACLNIGRFYGDFEWCLISHEWHHEKFLSGLCQCETHIDVIGNQAALMHQI